MTSTDPRPPFFQGAELTRLVALAAFGIFAVGMIYVYYLRDPNGAGIPAFNPRSNAPNAGSAPPPAPLDGPEFRGISDRSPLNSRENPAYQLLARMARDADPAELRRNARRDILFPQLYEDPGRYRGVPLHIEGTALRVIRQEVAGSRIFPSGTYYEVYTITPDGGQNPWLLVAESVPDSLPVGDSIRQPVVFDGYFFKLMAYRSAEPTVPGRTAPLLVGRLEVPASSGSPAVNIPSPTVSTTVWGWVLGVGLLLVGLRWALVLRSYLKRPAARPREVRPDPLLRAEIGPGDLDTWAASQAAEADDDDPE